MNTITVPAKDLTHKPTLDEELRMAIGMCFEKIAEFEKQVNQLTQLTKELKILVDGEKNETTKETKQS